MKITLAVTVKVPPMPEKIARRTRKISYEIDYGEDNTDLGCRKNTFFATSSTEYPVSSVNELMDH